MNGGRASLRRDKGRPGILWDARASLRSFGAVLARPPARRPLWPGSAALHWRILFAPLKFSDSQAAASLVVRAPSSRGIEMFAGPRTTS